MRCEAQDAQCGKPHKQRATKQRARIRQGKLGSLILATSLGSGPLHCHLFALAVAVHQIRRHIARQQGELY